MLNKLQSSILLSIMTTSMAVSPAATVNEANSLPPALIVQNIGELPTDASMSETLSSALIL